jgi:hypothetical protein
MENGKNEKMILEKISGWWLSHPSEKYEFVSWDDDIPKIWKVIKLMFQTTNQIVRLRIFGNELTEQNSQPQ